MRSADMSIIKAELQWVKEHAVLRDGRYYCRRTGELIQAVKSDRLVLRYGYINGCGRSQSVTHLDCLGCNPKGGPPREGTPIFENQLIEMDWK